MTNRNEEEIVLTPEQFKEALVERYKSRPLIVNEAELRKELEQTVVLRYSKGLDLLKGVSAALAQAKASAVDDDTRERLQLAASDIEQAVQAFAYGHLGYNRCGRADKGRHPHLILWSGDEPADKK